MASGHDSSPRRRPGPVRRPRRQPRPNHRTTHQTQQRTSPPPLAPAHVGLTPRALPLYFARPRTACGPLAASDARRSYENFPVAFLLPRACASRWKTSMPSPVRPTTLPTKATPRRWCAGGSMTTGASCRIEQGKTPSDPMFARLATNIRAFDLPMQLFRDLLDAFSQGYRQDPLRRLRRTPRLLPPLGNPGRPPPLRLYRADGAENLRRSDAICSALRPSSTSGRTWPWTGASSASTCRRTTWRASA